MYLYVTTPNANGFKFVADTLGRNLAKMNRAALDAYNTANPKSPKNYYIGRVFSPVLQMPAKMDPTWTASVIASYTALQQLSGGQAAGGSQ